MICEGAAARLASLETRGRIQMAGVLLHLAMGNPEKTDPDNTNYNASFKKAYTLGLLLPDIAKSGFIRDEEDFDRVFEGCSRDDILTYEEYLEFRKNHHFNPSRQNPSQQDTTNPNLKNFLDAGYVDLQTAVWQGVLCHLMGDKAFYFKSYCIDIERQQNDYIIEVGEADAWDDEKWRNSKTAKVYYEDYNLLNRCIEEQYGVLSKAGQIFSEPLLAKILNGFSVQFSSRSAEPVYMNWGNIRKCTDYFRRQGSDVVRGDWSPEELWADG